MANKTPDKKKDRKTPVSSFFKTNAVPIFWWLYVIIILVGAVCLASRYWECLLRDAGLARNLILVVAAAIGLPLAIWRSIVANRQSETAQRNLLNERYQKGAEMLDSEGLSVRLGGIYALERLAREHAENYHIPIIKILCAFVHKPYPPRDENDTIRKDVQAIMTALGGRNKKQQEIERQEIIENQEINAQPILSFNHAKLYGAWLPKANLSGAGLTKVDLSKAWLKGADLSNAWLALANLSGAELNNADLSGAWLEGARGLTQGQLDEAVADPKNPPDLTGAKDSKTGEPLVWRGKAPPSSSS